MPLKNMMNVPGAPGKTFEMKADIMNQRWLQGFSVYEVKVSKSVHNQPKTCYHEENAQVSVRRSMELTFLSVLWNK
jgi:hypothetical protein